MLCCRPGALSRARRTDGHRQSVRGPDPASDVFVEIVPDRRCAWWRHHPQHRLDAQEGGDKRASRRSLPRWSYFEDLRQPDRRFDEFDVLRLRAMIVIAGWPGPDNPSESGGWRAPFCRPLNVAPEHPSDIHKPSHWMVRRDALHG